jgi:hypothetical protein
VPPLKVDDLLAGAVAANQLVSGDAAAVEVIVPLTELTSPTRTVVASGHRSR